MPVITQIHCVETHTLTWNNQYSAHKEKTHTCLVHKRVPHILRGGDVHGNDNDDDVDDTTIESIKQTTTTTTTTTKCENYVVLHKPRISHSTRLRIDTPRPSTLTSSGFVGVLWAITQHHTYFNPKTQQHGNKQPLARKQNNTIFFGFVIRSGNCPARSEPPCEISEIKTSESDTRLEDALR